MKQLDSVLQKCLAKDRKQRFVSVAAMQQELIPAIERCPPFRVSPHLGQRNAERGGCDEDFANSEVKLTKNAHTADAPVAHRTFLVALTPQCLGIWWCLSQ